MSRGNAGLSGQGYSWPQVRQGSAYPACHMAIIDVLSTSSIAMRLGSEVVHDHEVRMAMLCNSARS